MFWKYTRSTFSLALLSGFKIKYAVLQKEALGIVWSLEHFYPYLYGRHFVVVTDHMLLKWLKTMTAPNNLFARWISKVQGYDFSVVHRPGRLHSNADTLSRYPVVGEDNVMVTSTNFSEIQKDDVYCNAWMNFLTNGMKPADNTLAAKLEREKEQHFVAKDGCVNRRYVPKCGKIRNQFIVIESMVGQILVKFHDSPLSVHPGFYRMYRKIQQSYFWPTMKTDIKHHTQHSGECAKFKSRKPPSKPLLNQSRLKDDTSDTI